jgi:hypothetical protein
MKNEKYWIEKKCKLCGKSFQSLIKRNQLFCSNGCSTKFTANNLRRISKIKKTKLEKYGYENYVNPEKAKQTCIEKYGVDNASKFEEIKNKIRKKTIEKQKIIKEKTEQSNLKKYGVKYYFQTDEFKNKYKKTCLQKYGVENSFQSNDIKETIKKTNRQKYGVEYFSQTDVFKKNISNIEKEKFFYKLSDHKLNIETIPLFTKDEYINTNKNNKYRFQCKKCGKIFLDHIDGGHLPRCLDCYPYMAGFSYGEKEIVEFLKNILPAGDTIIEKSRDFGFEIDIFIPNKKLAIEFNGLYWHSEIGGKKNKYYHLNKTKECENNNIHLIHIFEDEWMYKKEIVKNRLRHILKLNFDKIYARNCEVKEIDYKESSVFLEKNHLQGKDNSKIRLGLFHGGELVSIMTFGKNRFSKNKIGFEIYRYCSNKNIIGGASKLFSYFIKKYNPKKVISYSDRRFSTTDSFYKKLGFSLSGQTNPGYFYFKPGYYKRYYRFNFRKNLLNKKLENFKTNLTEWQNMQLNGYDRIWDCGNLKYEWNT